MRNDAKKWTVKRLDGERASADAEDGEALFSLAEVRTLRLAARHQKPSVADYLAREVARNPEELRRHVQRISLFLNKGDGPRVYGALADLFIALGERGAELRRRMLENARSLLTSEQFRALEDKLVTGLSPLDRIPLSTESILGKGIRGSTRLVERIDDKDAPTQDPLEEARSRLEYGQLDEARRVLEEAVLQEPLRGELHRELLEIYVHSKDYARFGSMFQALQRAGNPIPPAWQRLAKDFGVADTGEDPDSKAS